MERAIELFEYIVVINHEYSNPIKWKYYSKEMLNSARKKIKEEGMHLEIVSTKKLKK